MIIRGGTSRPVVVLDVLGTLVDQAGSLQRRVTAVNGLGGAAAAEVVRRWLDHVSTQERAINEDRRPFAPSHELDVEALEVLAGEGLLPSAAVSALADASGYLEPWPDSVATLDLMADDVTIIGLSNASRRVLTGLSAGSGMRWHQVLSAEDAGTYKPAAGIYEMATASIPVASAPIMVAAHAWDLRAAAAAGMRTAYVPRPDNDPPRQGDAFDLHAETLEDLHGRLRRSMGS